MIAGAHFLLYSKDPEADRTFFKTVLEFPSSSAALETSGVESSGLREAFLIDNIAENAAFIFSAFPKVK